ncbi:hypothetical protein Pmar_PMAR009414 [Perkinsus marinus ATCC 50983]|uniref:Serine carboxypeptidase n=1 Tax=Perkinsus marinus (strain ATCC 50983 / TXsc) TaxID=423536 RepID=C5KL11_PERM5|nr:hypothetical protein Pmar_PMAR009414 [Perkinsus marinus ATCC 50983]EER14819.1 hypothetical protein Pmar_PMAR009414 [Perkinsus marinus ATCC 50983]|eukprot:XP_002783023.1 hypothetical protein Pmar_PMAR009414 [Perkinsus marinus ATCC 50983]
MPEIKITNVDSVIQYAEYIGSLRSIRWKRKGMFGFFRVYQAGHFVPIDQPRTALFMINDFIDGTLGPLPRRAVMSGGSAEL